MANRLQQLNRFVEVSTGSPLHIALLADQDKVLELLLQSGANINVRADDVNGAAPLHWAAFFTNYAMVALPVAAGDRWERLGCIWIYSTRCRFD
jgi:hypothetical protein